MSVHETSLFLRGKSDRNVMIAPLEGAEGTWAWWSMVIRVRVAWVHPQVRRLPHTSAPGWFCFLGTLPRIWLWVCDGVFKVRIEVWCDWNPAESDLDDIAQSMGVGEAICTMREVVAVVDRPHDIEDEEAMTFFGGEEGDAVESQG